MSHHCLAWFKIAEALLNREREKAFFYCKLLSHSLSSEAFRSQIIGDIHTCIGEISFALQAYKNAFLLYEKNNNIHGMSIIFFRTLSIDNDFGKSLLQTYLEHLKSYEEYYPYLCEIFSHFNFDYNDKKSKKEFSAKISNVLKYIEK